MPLETPTIYLDHSAATPVDPRVAEAMAPFLGDRFANPSSIHDAGRQARAAIDASRAAIAALFGARPEEIVFTSGGTESNNLAILGACRAAGTGGKRIVTTAIEHHSVLRPIEYLARHEGFSAEVVGVDRFGLVNLDALEKSIAAGATLVSIQYANNEIGTVQPIAAIAKMVRRARRKSGSNYPLLHVDACQAAGAYPLDMRELGIDLMTVNGAKICGPKGIGILYVRRGVALAPLMFGGSHENGLRPGTENVAGIVGMAEALRLAAEHRPAETARLSRLRDILASEIVARVSGAVVNGHPIFRLPGVLHVSIPGADGEAMLIYLSSRGVHASAGAACDAGSNESSHVLTAIGMAGDRIRGSLRFSLGRNTVESDVRQAAGSLVEVLNILRVPAVDTAKTA
ncbi:MAG: cysteine desulfurase family protein [Patescibacteria group bacterium]